MTIEPKVSIIIPAYGLQTPVLRTLHSISESNYANAEIIVVNNGIPRELESDLEKLALTNKFELRVVGTRKNIGTSAGRNIGAKISTGDLLMFVDHDVVIEPNTITNLATLLMNDSSIGVCGPIIFYIELPEKVYWSGGTVILPSGRTMMNDDLFQGDLREVGSIPSVLVLKRSIFEQLGGFDERFFSGFEDADLCFRVQALGYRNVCSSKTKAFHGIPVSEPERTERILSRVELMFTSRAFFVKKFSRGNLQLMEFLLLYNCVFIFYYSALFVKNRKIPKIGKMLLSTFRGINQIVRPITS